MRMLRRLLLAVLVIIALLALGIWLTMRGSLPRLTGEATLPGLAAGVEIQRDALGVATIDAANEVDAVRALGYVHAQERFFEMDLLRRTAAGELAALFGPIAVDTDKRHRLHRLRSRIQAALVSMTQADRAVLQAYTEGVNAGLAALRVRPWAYLPLRQKPQPWRIEDSSLVGFAMYFDLQDSQGKDELTRLRLQPHLPPALFALLQHAGSTWDAPMAGRVHGDAVLPDATQVDLRTLPTPATRGTIRVGSDIVPGSNNFAVAGSLTADGRAILANDMHLGLRAPNIWFRARLRYPDPRAPGGRVDATGFTLPGLPAVIAGSNGHIAWGYTNSYADTADWQRVRPCGTHGERGCAPVQRHVERIAVAGAAPVTLPIEETAWGPILHRDADGSALALRWVAVQHDALNLQLRALLHTDTIDAALRLALGIRMPAQNLLIADRAGRIAWRVLGALPQRGAGCDAGLLEQPATCAPWPVSNVGAPTLVDPPSGRLWSANNRTTDGAMLQRMGDAGYALGARARQIRDGLFARERFDERALLAIQLDDRALFLQRWRDLLLQTSRSARTPALQRLADVAAQPMPRAAPDSTSYRVVRQWRLAVLARILDGLTAPAQVAMQQDDIAPQLGQLEGIAWPLVTQRPPHLLPRRHASWDALFEDAAREVLDELGGGADLPTQTWGRRNIAAICHPLAKALPLGQHWLCMPAQPLPGDAAMPRVQSPTFGASERMVVSPGHEADGIAHMPGGQSGHPLSPFWGAGHADWAAGRASSFLPGESTYRMRLHPTQGPSP